VGADDDGDYFTWTRTRPLRHSRQRNSRSRPSFYDIGTAEKMHHNPAKNVAVFPGGHRSDGPPAAPSGRARGGTASFGSRQDASCAGHSSRAIRGSHPVCQLERDDGLGPPQRGERC
jgi:hypothetical protein